MAKGLSSAPNLKCTETKWYTIDYAILKRLADQITGDRGGGSSTEPTQADQEGNTIRPMDQNDPTIPETTPEITPKTSPPPQAGTLRKQAKNGGGDSSKSQIAERCKALEQKYPEIAKFVDNKGIQGPKRLVVLEHGDLGYSEYDLQKLWSEVQKEKNVKNPTGLFLYRLPGIQNDKPPLTYEGLYGSNSSDDSEQEERQKRLVACLSTYAKKPDEAQRAQADIGADI